MARATVTAFAAAVAAGGNTIFGALNPGEKFRFPGFDVIYVKGKGGWYRADYAGHLGKAHYRTGRYTAVVKL